MAEPLFPYQEEGAQWLAKRKLALLADEMGIGKTAQAIRAADLCQARKLLVIAPAVARVNWSREFARFSTMPREIFVQLDGKTLDVSESVITSYELATRNHGLLCDSSWDGIILDEQHFLKSVTTQRSAAIFGRTGIVRSAKRVWCLTGTPMPNNPSELWIILYSFGATKLSYDKFVERFCNYINGPRGKVITGQNHAHTPELREMLRSIMFRRTKEQVLPQLPNVITNPFIVEPGEFDFEEAFVQYVFPEDRRAEFNAQIEREKAFLLQVLGTSEMTVLETVKAMEATAKSVATVRRLCGLQKIEPTAEKVAWDLTEGRQKKIVVFAIHQSVIEGIRRKLTKFRPVTLYGNTPTKKRQENIDRFKNDPKCQVFIGNIHAAGTAIDLTAAHRIYFAETDWTPGNNAQAIARCHRYPQKKTVVVYYVMLNNSIDEKITSIVRRKTSDILRTVNDPDEPYKVDGVIS